MGRSLAHRGEDLLLGPALLLELLVELLQEVSGRRLRGSGLPGACSRSWPCRRRRGPPAEARPARLRRPSESSRECRLPEQGRWEVVRGGRRCSPIGPFLAAAAAHCTATETYATAASLCYCRCYSSADERYSVTAVTPALSRVTVLVCTLIRMCSLSST